MVQKEKNKELEQAADELAELIVLDVLGREKRSKKEENKSTNKHERIKK